MTSRQSPASRAARHVPKPEIPRPQFTCIQRAMLEVLKDGLRHTKQELHGCLYDDLGALRNVENHIMRLRHILLPFGQTIVCEYYHKKWYYRHVILLTPQVSLLS